jgi:hypothetical protein
MKKRQCRTSPPKPPRGNMARWRGLVNARFSASGMQIPARPKHDRPHPPWLRASVVHPPPPSPTRCAPKPANAVSSFGSKSKASIPPLSSAPCRRPMSARIETAHRKATDGMERLRFRIVGLSAAYPRSIRGPRIETAPNARGPVRASALIPSCSAPCLRDSVVNLSLAAPCRLHGRDTDRSVPRCLRGELLSGCALEAHALARQDEPGIERWARTR